MLIGCITGLDFETAKRQIAIANRLCDGIELRKDLLGPRLEPFADLAEGTILFADGDRCVTSEGQTISLYHNFEETPEDLNGILARMPSADLYKIACMANRTTDSLRMLDFIKDKPHVAGMCMGELGQITRILAPIYDSPLAFTAIGKEAAPGQLQVEELLQTYNFRGLNPKTQIYGMIGNPIVQSPSHRTHNAYFKQHGIDAVYVKMLLEEEEMGLFFELAKKIGVRGLSVTIPYKEKVIDFIDAFEGDAGAIGAVNTLSFEDCIYGANTDAPGALDAIEEKLFVKGKNCVILGAGGSSKAIAFEAKKRGAQVTILSRRFGNLDAIPSYDILINTTPVACPIDLNKILPGKVVMDISLAHRDSPLMVRARDLECLLVYGHEMFQKQALGQFKRWFKRNLCPLTL